MMQAIKDHVHVLSGAFRRGKNHKTPDSVKDIEILNKAYLGRRIMQYIPGRKFDHIADVAADWFADGQDNLRGAVARWKERRATTKSTKEDPNDLDR
jgi:hypothetical protein